VLAYVFSHRPAAGVDVTDYEAALKRFHAALAAGAPTGFLSSSTFRIGDGYSDWYLVEGSAALDLLNEAAISDARSSAHDTAASMAVDGVGKLYGLMDGEPASGSGFEMRFSKPRGTGYADLYERMRPFSSRPRTSLWRRMMVLGPAPEFCLIAPLEVELAADLRPEVLRRDPI
jgi:hypothetical protein